MKILDGKELAGFVKERQAKQVRALRQSWKVFPRLAIVQTKQDPVIDTYIRLKRRYAEDILVETELYSVSDQEALAVLERLNKDDNVHGIIVQLPLEDISKTDEIINAITPEKDVDGLGKNADFDSATAMAINWLLGGYGVELAGKKIAIVGNGRLVGAPLARMWSNSGYDTTVFNRSNYDIESELINFSVVVSATGRPGLIKSHMLQPGAVVVDAGTADDSGSIVGDLDSSVRLREDLTITPEKGGVGPLTVAALLDNTITAARKVADQIGQQDI